MEYSKALSLVEIYLIFNGLQEKAARVNTLLGGLDEVAQARIIQAMKQVFGSPTED